MKFLGDWITGISAASLVLAAVLSLAPEGQPKRVVRLAGGACVMLSVLLPLGRIDIADFSAQLPALDESYAETAAVVERSNYDLTELIITDRMAAYIQQKADVLGAEIGGVAVYCENTDGLPMPTRAVIECAAGSDAIAALVDDVAAQLGMSVELRQVGESAP